MNVILMIGIILRTIFIISKIILNFEKISEDQLSIRNLFSALSTIDFVVLMIIFVLLKIIKNSLEFYNLMMIILIVRSGLIPYLNYTIERY